VGPSVGLDSVDKRKILNYLESKPGRLACKPSLYRLSRAQIWKGNVRYVWRSFSIAEQNIAKEQFDSRVDKLWQTYQIVDVYFISTQSRCNLVCLP
jgi:hypothetical protein